MKTQMQALTSAMKRSISNVLETMFFLTLEIDSVVSWGQYKSRLDDSFIVAKLGFSGPLSGFCRLFVPEKLAAEVTADFLGVGKTGLTNRQINGTVTEIINMLAGDTFSHFSPQALFDLTIPELITAREALNDVHIKDGAEITLDIRTQGFTMAFQMVIEDGA